MNRPARLARLSLLGGILAILGIACSSTATDVVDPSSTAGALPTETAAPATGITDPQAVPEVLDFTAPRLGGGAITGADYAGKDLAIWFWAPW